MRHQHGEIGQSLTLGLPHSRGVGWGRRFESNRQKDYFVIGMLAGNLDCFDRRISNADIGSLRLGMKQIGVRTGNAQHVSVGDQSHTGTQGKGDCLVDRLQGRNADRTAGPMHEFNLCGKQFIEAITHDGMGLATADLHQHPGVGGALRDFFD